MYSAVICFQRYGKSLGTGRRMLGKRLDYELERTRKEGVAARFETASRYFAGGTGESDSKRARITTL
jgi:hypothetical protein